jgi:hypothetical protein
MPFDIRVDASAGVLPELMRKNKHKIRDSAFVKRFLVINANSSLQNLKIVVENVFTNQYYTTHMKFLIAVS